MFAICFSVKDFQMLCQVKINLMIYLALIYKNTELFTSEGPSLQQDPSLGKIINSLTS